MSQSWDRTGSCPVIVGSAEPAEMSCSACLALLGWMEWPATPGGGWVLERRVSAGAGAVAGVVADADVVNGVEQQPARE